MSVTSHVEVISLVDEVLKAKDLAVEKAMILCGEFLEGEAKDEIGRPKPHADGSVRPNVDTGRLRNSITYATNTMHSTGEHPATPPDWGLQGTVPEGEVIIGTNVEYGPFVEMGTSRSRPYPFLRPALENNKATLKKILEDTLKS